MHPQVVCMNKQRSNKYTSSYIPSYFDNKHVITIGEFEQGIRAFLAVFDILEILSS